MPEEQSLTILGLGFLLGARHALDADHVAAVATIVSGRPEVRTSGFLGLCWGIGHTLVLLVFGSVVVALQIVIPESFTRVMEIGVGILLVGLGASLTAQVFRERWHVHAHQHGRETHLHVHNHRASEEHRHSHWLRLSIKPLAVGMAHGLAGSAAIVLMTISTVHSLWGAMAYILMFGLGSILGMVVLGVAISVPLVLSASIGRYALATVQGLTSLGSMVLGLSIIYRTGFGTIPF